MVHAEEVVVLWQAGKAMTDVANKNVTTLAVRNGVLPAELRACFPNTHTLVIYKATPEQLLQLCCGLWQQISTLKVAIDDAPDSNDADVLSAHSAALHNLLAATAPRPSFTIASWNLPIHPSAAARLLQRHPHQPYLHIVAASAGATELPSDLHEVEHLELRGSFSSPGSQAWDLSPLAGARKLRVLRMSKVLPTTVLAACTALQELVVHHVSGTSEALLLPLQPLAALQQLRTLALRNINCPAGSWHALASLPLLEELDVNYLQLPELHDERQHVPQLAALRSLVLGNWEAVPGMAPGQLAWLLPSLQLLQVFLARSSVNGLLLTLLGHPHLARLWVSNALAEAVVDSWLPAAQHIGPALDDLALPLVMDMAGLVRDVAGTTVGRLELTYSEERAVLQQVPYEAEVATVVVGALLGGAVRLPLRHLHLQGFCKLRLEEALQLAAQLPTTAPEQGLPHWRLQAAVVLPQPPSQALVIQLALALRERLLCRGWLVPSNTVAGEWSQEPEQLPGVRATVEGVEEGGQVQAWGMAVQVVGWLGDVAGMASLELDLDVYVEPVGLDIMASSALLLQHYEGLSGSAGSLHSLGLGLGACRRCAGEMSGERRAGRRAKGLLRRVGKLGCRAAEVCCAVAVLALAAKGGLRVAGKL